MWIVADPRTGRFVVRHTYKYQSNDEVTAYYEFHDGWSACREIIEDPIGNVRFEIDFLKQITENGNNIDSKWKALINMKPLDPSKPFRVIPYVYLTKEKFISESDKFKV